MRRTRSIFLLASSIFFALGAATFYFFGEDIKQQFFPIKDTNVPGGAISKNEPILTCAAGDITCAQKNEKILANRLDGVTAKFVSHQCDGPRACPTPNEEEAQIFTSAIKAYVKEPHLTLIRITGLTPKGMIYYCAPDERCWSYDTKSKEISIIEHEVSSSTSSNSAQ